MSNNTQKQGEFIRNPDRIGALWPSKFKDKNGNSYLTGEIEVNPEHIIDGKLKIAVYRNKEVQNKNSPHFSMWIQKEKPKTANTAAVAPKTAVKPATAQAATAARPARPTPAPKPPVDDPPFEPDEPEDFPL